jgi:succinoglycan biosynthesis protein ExoH
MRLDRALGERIRAISVLCSLLVCLNHAYTVPPGPGAADGEPFARASAILQYAVKYGFSCIATPFFFAVAGFVLFRALYPTARPGPLDALRYREQIHRRLATLLVPFLLISGWSFALMAALQAIPGVGERAGDPLAARGWARLLETLFWSPVAYPLWFIRNLFLLALAAPIIALVLRSPLATAASFAAAAVAWFAWPEWGATRSLLFFAAGSWLAVHPLRLPECPPRLRGVLALAWVGLVGAHATEIAVTGVNAPALHNATILVGLAAVWFGYPSVAGFAGRPRVQRAGAYTFFIYLAHEPSAAILRKAVIAALGAHDRHLLLLIAWPALGAGLFLGMLALAVGCNRHAPRIYALVSGGRVPRPEPPPAEPLARSG